MLEALKLWEQVCGITFIEVPDAAERWSGGIRFLLETLSAGALGETTTLRRASPTAPRSLYSAGSTPMIQWGRGARRFDVLLHEIGHAIGLKHPFEGSTVLPTIHDNTVNTVMSYTDLGNHSALGRFDIAAAQYLYGTNAAEEALAVRWSRGPDGAFVSTGNDAANTINGLAIRDIVRAGGGADTIRTLGGNDDILPGAGADTVCGGDGMDTVWAETPRRQAALTQLGGAKELVLGGSLDLLVEVETIRFHDGQVAFHADSAAGQVFRLYGAALGRRPDPIGFGEWVQETEAGASDLEAVAAGFVGSAEFAARFGAPDNAGFVTLLYANVLGRAPDAAGLNYWTNAMATGTSRAGALLGFSESAEYKQRTAANYHAGLWVPDPEAVDVLRSLRGGAGPPAGRRGLGGLDGGARGRPRAIRADHGFVQSPEFQTRFGGLSNRDFVEQLYWTALDRDADPDGRGLDRRSTGQYPRGRSLRLRQQRRDDRQAHAPGRGRHPLGLSTGPRALDSIGSLRGTTVGRPPTGRPMPAARHRTGRATPAPGTGQATLCATTGTTPGRHPARPTSPPGHSDDRRTAPGSRRLRGHRHPPVSGN